MPAGKHNAVVIKEFTKKADAFSDWLARPSLDEVLEQMVRMAGVRRTDRVLDVGCGPGLVACRFAADACHVTGIDLTPAFLDHARKLQVKTGLANLSWEIGDAQNLRYPDESFDIVVSRFAFHHISRRKTAFREMVRVCKPGGVILLADLVISARKRAVFNGIERRKDPSHVSAMTRGEYTDLARSERLGGVRTCLFRLEMDLEKQLGAMIRDPGEAEAIRRAYRDDIPKNSLGMDARPGGGSFLFSYSCMILAGRKPG